MDSTLFSSHQPETQALMRPTSKGILPGFLGRPGQYCQT